MTDTAANPARKSQLEKAARPLLLLAQKITGMETTLVTSIDWTEGNQKVLYSLNQGLLEVPEGLTVDCTTPCVAPCSCRASPRAAKLVRRSRRRRAQPRSASRQSEAATKEAVAAKLAAERHAADSLHMEYLAHTDVLTGLPNRRAFMARWEDELARSGRRHYPIGLMLIDADHFKSVNDTAGHAVGDAVLRSIGATLMEVADSPDVVARLGGDEFALVTTHTDQAHLEALAGRIQQLFAVAAAELGVATTLSIGMVSSHDCPRDRLLTDADAALYRSKHAGGNTASMFTSAAGTQKRSP